MEKFERQTTRMHYKELQEIKPELSNVSRHVKMNDFSHVIP